MMNEVVNLIGSVGFPIVACCYMAHYQKTTLDSLRDVINSNTKATERMIDALNNDSGIYVIDNEDG